MITKLWAINVLHASQVEGKALAFLPFYKNAIRRIHPLQFLWNCTDLPFWCLWHGPENFIEIFADLRILDPTDHERQLINTSRPASNLKERPENWLLRIEIWFGKRRIFIKGLFVTSLCFPLSQHRGFYFPPSAEADGPPFSPERKTCYMLFISEAIAFLLSLSVSSSVILSFVPTYCNQLSTSRRLVPLSLQKGASFCKLSLVIFSIFAFS